MTARKKKTITITEFKAWLEGVEEMQGSEWSPDKQQWKRIRQKINQLDATAAPAVVPSNFTTNATVSAQRLEQPAQPVDEETPIVFPHIPSSFEKAGVSVPPPKPRAVIPPNAGSTPRLQTTRNAEGQEKVKTPDIEGPYSTPFE